MMAIECATELFNTIYIAKKLCDMGKYGLVTQSFSDLLDYDLYYENMYCLIENLFEYHHCRYYENRYLEIHLISDPVMVDFYILAGKYGKINKLSIEENPFIKEAERKIHEELNFSYCLDWRVMGHTEPKRSYHSRLGLFISQEDYVDLSCLAYGLIEIYEWFKVKCAELNKLLDGTNVRQKILPEEAIAA